MTKFEPTPGQTVGPFFALGMAYDRMEHVVHPHSEGAVTLSGRILDGAGAGVPDAAIEIFGADSDGSVPHVRGALRRDDRNFTGFGRAATDDEGRFLLWTREPGQTGHGAAFFAAIIFARGLPAAVRTRIYLPGDSLLSTDPLLAGLTPSQRETLVAERLEDGHLVHDIRLQGERETVFLVH